MLRAIWNLPVRYTACWSLRSSDWCNASTKFASSGSRQAVTANRKRERAFSTDTVNAALAHLDSLIRQDRSNTMLQQQSLVLHWLNDCFTWHTIECTAEYTKSSITVFRFACEIQGTHAQEELAGLKVKHSSKIQKLSVLYNASEEEQACKKQRQLHTPVIHTQQAKRFLETSLRQEDVTNKQLNH